MESKNIYEKNIKAAVDLFIAQMKFEGCLPVKEYFSIKKLVIELDWDSDFIFWIAFVLLRNTSINVNKAYFEIGIKKMRKCKAESNKLFLFILLFFTK